MPDPSRISFLAEGSENPPAKKDQKMPDPSKPVFTQPFEVKTIFTQPV